VGSSLLFGRWVFDSQVAGAELRSAPAAGECVAIYPDWALGRSDSVRSGRSVAEVVVAAAVEVEVAAEEVVVAATAVEVALAAAVVAAVVEVAEAATVEVAAQVVVVAEAVEMAAVVALEVVVEEAVAVAAVEVGPQQLATSALVRSTTLWWPER
jgi:hypothetical protein